MEFQLQSHSGKMLICELLLVFGFRKALRQKEKKLQSLPRISKAPLVNPLMFQEFKDQSKISGRSSVRKKGKDFRMLICTTKTEFGHLSLLIGKITNQTLTVNG